MQILYQNLTVDQVNAYCLVLAASGFSYYTKRSRSGWDILVEDSAVEKATAIMEEHISENQAIPSVTDTIDFPYPKAVTGVWASVVMVSVYVAIALMDENRLFVSGFGSSAAKITDGDFYRTITSLFLHANAGHIASNAIGIAIFGTVVCRIAGWGVGILMILLAGGLGNLLNAFMYKLGHVSIGASTSVFGAIGILSGYIFMIKFRQFKARRTSWLPIGGGFALLSIHGSSEHTDIMAHLYGFLVGLLFGSSCAVWEFRLQKIKLQIFCMIIVLSIVVGSFYKGF